MGFSYLWGSVFPNAMIKKNVKLVPKPSVTAAAGEGWCLSSWVLLWTLTCLVSLQALHGGIMVIALSQSCPVSAWCFRAVCAGSCGIPSSLGVCKDQWDEHPSGTCSWGRPGTGEAMSRASALFADRIRQNQWWGFSSRRTSGEVEGKVTPFAWGRDCAWVQVLPRSAPVHPFRVACSCQDCRQWHWWSFLLSSRLAGWCGIGWWVHLPQELQWSCMMDLL